MVELFALGFFISAIYGAFCITRGACRRTIAIARQHRAPRLPDQVLRRSPQPAVSAAVRNASRAMQLALIQLPDAPDFRRAASFAVQAQAVPAVFRQRQYRRFRPVMVSRFASLMESSVRAEELMPGLTQLVSALGMAPFEADYIRTDAQSQIIPQIPPRPDFGQQLRDAQSAYRNRVQTLESLQELDSETREQLMEQEKIRFEEQLREISTRQGTGHEP